MSRKSGVKKVIVDIWRDNPGMPPKEIQDKVFDRLGEKRSKGRTYPGLRIVQKYMKEFMENLGQLEDEDKPWSVAASVKKGFPPEATKDLFDIWRASSAMGNPISIRQAKWIVYIRKLFFQGIPTGNLYSDKVNRNLWLIRQSWLYSMLERSSQIMGEINFDTTNLDAASFMSNIEYSVALKLAMVLSVEYPQEALAKIEKHGTSLTSPSISTKSVEQAVWHSVRAEPPQDDAIMALGFSDSVLPEEQDLVAAYWLMHLSKGPLWNNLPRTPGMSEELEHRSQQRANGDFIPDSGGIHDDPMYRRQLTIRHKVLECVKKHPIIGISPKLLTMVGYEVPPEELKLYAQMYEKELKQEHHGWGLLPVEVRQRFICEEETSNDLDLLDEADLKNKEEQFASQQEFLELVKSKGVIPTNKEGFGKIRAFWISVLDAWVTEHQKGKKKSPYRYHHWEEVKTLYENLIEKR